MPTSVSLPTTRPCSMGGRGRRPNALVDQLRLVVIDVGRWWPVLEVGAARAEG